MIGHCEADGEGCRSQNFPALFYEGTGAFVAVPLSE